MDFFKRSMQIFWVRFFRSKKLFQAFGLSFTWLNASWDNSAWATEKWQAGDLVRVGNSWWPMAQGRHVYCWLWFESVSRWANTETVCSIRSVLQSFFSQSLLGCLCLYSSARVEELVWRNCLKWFWVWTFSAVNTARLVFPVWTGSAFADVLGFLRVLTVKPISLICHFFSFSGCLMMSLSLQVEKPTFCRSGSQCDKKTKAWIWS